MCGIVGAISKRSVTPLLIEGLKRLEYRGYDSAGITVIDSKNQFLLLRTPGKVRELERLIDSQPVVGKIGIAHTRWATHGKPNQRNAHPHIVKEEIALVHNGIIENDEALRAFLIKQGCTFTSETDSELIAHLIHINIKKGQNFLTAVQSAIKKLEGAYALGLLHNTEPDHLIAVRYGSPLVIGLGDNENFIASDQIAISSITKQFIYLENGDIADIQCDSITIYNSEGQQVERAIHTTEMDYEMATKGKYQHFMLKEIFEQPQAILSTVEDRITSKRVLAEAFGEHSSATFKKINRIQIVACGTSYHAGLVGKFWLEEIAKLPTHVEIASEYRYRHNIVEPNTLFVTLSQSGETADTLAALRLAKKSGYAATLTICNMPESSIVREADLAFLTNAGVEIGVASTKSFTTQLAALFMLALTLGQFHQLDPEVEIELIKQLRTLPEQLKNALALNPKIKELASELYTKQNVLFLGRGIQFPIALEGALKLKEIAYIHAEACPAGELKHGPIALIDSKIALIMLAPADELLEKLKSNLQEILARNGKLFIFANEKSAIKANKNCNVITVPFMEGKLEPILYAVCMQLLAYQVAVLKGTDIDQPRNLAKSVTVE